MSKSIYSLVLNDQVIEAVDALACKQGVSRSNMIERLLAQCVSCDTPEQRYRAVFDGISKLIDTNNILRFLDMPSYNMACIMSVLPYKYNPTVRYSVELFENDNQLGQLKVSLRTSSAVLKQLLQDFFELFGKMENSILPYEVQYTVEDGKFTRTLYNYCVTHSQLSESLTDYIKTMHEMLRLYINSTDNSQDVLDKLIEIYKNYTLHNATL